MPKRIRTIIAALVVLVAMIAVLMLVPVNFVAWAPGQTYNLLDQTADGPVVNIVGSDAYGTQGSILLTTVSQTRADANLRFASALLAHLLPDHDVLPREVIYPDGVSAEQATVQELDLMDQAKTYATVVALRQAGRPVRESVRVSRVRVSGPANGLLQENDVILAIDQVPVATADEAVQRIRQKSINDVVVVTVDRPGRTAPLTITVPTVPSANDGKIPTIGVTVVSDFTFDITVDFRLDPTIGGGSAGLALALAIYDRLTPGELTAGQSVAATGTVDPVGAVGAIGAVNQKVAAAEAAGAKVLLIPQANCATLNNGSNLQLIPVSSFSQALAALAAWPHPELASQVPHC
jgi:PDZ domain-containing protein